jgi:hypothetical protein
VKDISYNETRYFFLIIPFGYLATSSFKSVVAAIVATLLEPSIL